MLLELQLDEMGTYLHSPSEPMVQVTLGFNEVVQDYLLLGLSLDYGIEMAIGAIEDAMAKIKKIMPEDQLVSTSPQILKIARASGLPGRGSLHREAVENLFYGLVASSRYSAVVDHTPDEMSFIASLLLIRELMHHQNIESVTV